MTTHKTAYIKYLYELQFPSMDFVHGWRPGAMCAAKYLLALGVAKCSTDSDGCSKAGSRVSGSEVGNPNIPKSEERNVGTAKPLLEIRKENIKY